MKVITGIYYRIGGQTSHSAIMDEFSMSATSILQARKKHRNLILKKGEFTMLGKLFGKKTKETKETVLAPLTGVVRGLEEVPDPVFSQKMMGDGFAIEPNEGTVVSPVDGEIIQFFPTKHAIGIRSKTGLEILIHVGLETVAMNGEGFTGHVKEGDKVRVGEKLINFDLDLVKEKAKSTITPVVITNGDLLLSMAKLPVTEAEKGSTALLQTEIKS